MSSLRALSEMIGAARAVRLALRRPRHCHYWHTPEAGGKVDKDKVTQVGRALMQLGMPGDGLGIPRRSMTRCWRAGAVWRYR